MNETECQECAIDPEQLMREKILKEFAEQDFVRVRRCLKCGFFKGCDGAEPQGASGWCERYDELRIDYDYCSEAKKRQEAKEG